VLYGSANLRLMSEASNPVKMDKECQREERLDRKPGISHDFGVDCQRRDTRLKMPLALATRTDSPLKSIGAGVKSVEKGPYAGCQFKCYEPKTTRRNTFNAKESAARQTNPLPVNEQGPIF